MYLHIIKIEISAKIKIIDNFVFLKKTIYTPSKIL